MISKKSIIIFSLILIILLSPLLIIISILIRLESKGNPIFSQKRVGQESKSFIIYKFRTMIKNAESKGKKITVGKDKRITKIGSFLREYKLDELERKLLLYTASKGYKVKASYRDVTPLHKSSDVFKEVLQRTENIIIYSRSQVSTNVDYLNTLLNKDKRTLIVVDEDNDSDES